MRFEAYFYRYLRKAFAGSELHTELERPQKLLRVAMDYTLKSPASRFRPQLCFATAQFLGKSPQHILPWAIAIEMIHTASLIHDDMPCMDNEKTRRGRASNHIKFGQDISLLAGTCLFVESFALLKHPLFDKKMSAMLELLVATAGFKGLMSGQALDLRIKKPSAKQNLKIMQLKTAVLISACVEGPVILWPPPRSQKKLLLEMAQNLGLAYQFADDFKDEKSRKKACFREGVKRLDSNLKLLQTLKGDTKALQDLHLSLKARFYPPP